MFTSMKKISHKSPSDFEFITKKWAHLGKILVICKTLGFKRGTYNGGYGLDIDVCVSEAPCVNGECIDLRQGYQCNCRSGWTGQRCNGNIAYFSMK